jgi:D-alanine transaminase
VKAGKLLTPPTAADLLEPRVAAAAPYPKSATLPGITRGVALELARRQGMEVASCAINITQLVEAEEVFLTNSIMGIMPVCRIERRAIGQGRPGALTRRLSELYEEEIRHSV